LEFKMDGVHPGGGFDDYVCGVIAALLEADVQIAGCDIAIASDLPMGAAVVEMSDEFAPAQSLRAFERDSVARQRC
ncbi:MAG: hypothetical protein ABGW98_08565, partial [Myxococcales bacterium]